MAKHWRAMGNQDSYLNGVFKEPPLIAYRRNQNIRGHLIRARVAKYQRPKRYIKAMKKCGSNCTSCPYIKEGKSLKINNSKWTITKQLDCNTYNLVYAIFCTKENCKEVYIGETKRMLRSRVAEHRGYVSRGETNQPTGAHFSKPGHSLADLKVSVIEHTRGRGTEYRKEREHYFIRRFDTYYRGMNNQK